MTKEGCSNDMNTILVAENDFDTSWADQDEESLQKEPMTDITCFVLYIDSEGHMKHVFREKQLLDAFYESSDSQEVSAIRKIPRARLLQFIQTKKLYAGVKYRLMEILLYNIELENNHLLTYPYPGTLKEVTIMDEIKVPPSLCIFHDINCIYFLFKEIPKYDDDEPVIPKPSLKILSDTCSLTSAKRKKTKKVTFKELDLRHTKKRFSSFDANEEDM
jgi:hypothetical protein